MKKAKAIDFFEGQPGDYLVIGQKADGREFAYSCHKTAALAQAKIVWYWRKKEPLTRFTII